jgi:hypothetical protein
MIAGYLILSVASRAKGWTAAAVDQDASPTGAIKTVADSSGGALLLWMLAIGMLLYAAWRLVTALLHGETDVEAWVRRIGYVPELGVC